MLYNPDGSSLLTVKKPCLSPKISKKKTLDSDKTCYPSYQLAGTPDAFICHPNTLNNKMGIKSSKFRLWEAIGYMIQFLQQSIKEKGKRQGEGT